MANKRKNNKLEGRVGSFKKVSFVLDYDYDIEDLDRVNKVWFGIIKQAKDDYVKFKFSKCTKERSLYETAKEFIFNDEYKIDTGDRDLSLTEILAQFNVNIKWFRALVVSEEKEVNKDKDYKIGTQLPLF